MLSFPSAKIILRHPEDSSQILMIKRTIKDKYFYEPVGGKIEVDFKNNIAETFEQCAIREAKEELGLSVQIDRYLGSYYFFWKIDPLKYSACVVYLGDIIDTKIEFRTNM